MGKHTHQAKMVPLGIERCILVALAQGAATVGEQEGNQGGGTLGSPETQGQLHRDRDAPAGKRQGQKVKTLHCSLDAHGFMISYGKDSLIGEGGVYLQAPQC